MSITTENLKLPRNYVANSTAEQPEKHEMLAFLAEMEDAQKEMDKLLLTLAVMSDQTIILNWQQSAASLCLNNNEIKITRGYVKYNEYKALSKLEQNCPI